MNHIDTARFAATLSDDPDTQVGAALVRPVPALGHPYTVAHAANGYPHESILREPSRLARPYKYSWMNHAEAAVIAACARDGLATDGTHLYLHATRPFFPCAPCARLIAAAGIRRVVMDPLLDPDDAPARDSDAAYDFETARSILREAGVRVEGV